MVRFRSLMTAAVIAGVALVQSGCSRSTTYQPMPRVAPAYWQYWHSRDANAIVSFINERHPRHDGVQVAVNDPDIHVWVRTGDVNGGTWSLGTRNWTLGEASGQSWLNDVTASPDRYVPMGFRAGQLLYLEVLQPPR
jgi:hypothetical protein